MVCGNLETLVLPVEKLNFTDTDVDSMLKCLDIPEIGRILCRQHPFCRSLLCKLDFFWRTTFIANDVFCRCH